MASETRYGAITYNCVLMGLFHKYHPLSMDRYYQSYKREEDAIDISMTMLIVVQPRYLQQINVSQAGGFASPSFERFAFYLS